jgi:thioredoxin-related protein
MVSHFYGMNLDNRKLFFVPFWLFSPAHRQDSLYATSTQAPMTTMLLESLMKVFLHGFSLLNTAAAALVLTLSGSLPESAPPLAASVGANMPEAAEASPILIRNIDYPDWFADSLLNLPRDLQQARDKGKRGLMLYFSSEGCGYCKLMQENVLADPTIASYIQRHFDAIAIDVAGTLDMRDFNGKRLSEQEFAQQMQATGTPTLVFIDSHSGQELDRAQGYQSLYSLSSLLAYLAAAPPQSLAQYREQAEPCTDFLGQLGESGQAQPGLDQCQALGRPLAVFFSVDGASLPLQPQAIRRDLEQIERMVLPLASRRVISTPEGACLRIEQWATWLGLEARPAAVLFDSFGQASHIAPQPEALQAGLRDVLGYPNAESEPDQLAGVGR